MWHTFPSDRQRQEAKVNGKINQRDTKVFISIESSVFFLWGGEGRSYGCQYTKYFLDQLGPILVSLPSQIVALIMPMTTTNSGGNRYRNLSPPKNEEHKMSVDQ